MDAATNGGDLRRQRVGHRRILRHDPVDREAQRDPRAADRRRPRPAVRLEHVAVERDLALAECLQVGNRAQTTPDQPLDFLRPPRLLALGSLACPPRVGGARQHPVFGGDPALALAAQPWRQPLLDRRRDEDVGVTEFDEARALGMGSEAGDNLDTTHCIGGAAGGAHGFFQSIRRRKQACHLLSPPVERNPARAYIAAMQSPPITDLTDRAREVFRQIVESFIEHGTPVGSRTLSKLTMLGLSPASIRNVMQDLEELGLLAAPHASAGRLPTELGLRLFVDGLMQTTAPTDAERGAIETQVAAPASIADILGRTTAVLSGLSACAGIVLVPAHEMVVRQVSFVPLSTTRALAILVGADGTVENRVIDLPPGVPPTALIEAANYINTRLHGLTLAEAVVRLRAEIDADRARLDGLTRTLVETGLASWSSDGAARPILIVRGSAHLVAGDAADLDRVRTLLDDLEGKEELVRLLDSASGGEACKIFIGAENKLFSLSGSSVIAAPYRSGAGRVVGVVGVIGPTRLNYARVVPMVDYTAKALSRLIA